MARRLVGILVLVVVGVMLTLAAQRKKAGDTGAPMPAAREAVWSGVVNGVQGRVTMERGEVVNGTAVISTRLWLRNVRDVGNALTFPWTRAVLTFRVEDAAGVELKKTSMEYEEVTALPVDFVLPYKGELSFDISHHGAGIMGDQLAMIDLGAMDGWVIPRDGKAYFLKGTLEVTKNGKEAMTQSWEGTLELPAVRVPTGEVVLSEGERGAVIAEWGPKLRAASSSTSEEAFRRLSLVNDERVVPGYVTAMGSNDDGVKVAALDRLSRFDSEEALSGIKMGMATRGADIGNCSTLALAEELAGQVRHRAAGALARTPVREGKALLMTMADDRSVGVRVTVVQTAGRMQDGTSRAVLEKLTKDGDVMVRQEAVRCLKERDGKRE